MSMIAWGSSCVNGWDADSNTSNTQMEYAADVAIANGGECLCDSVILQKKRFAGFDVCNNLCLTLCSKIRSPNVINLNSVPHVCTLVQVVCTFEEGGSACWAQAEAH